MDPERIIGELIGGFLGGKKKRRRGGLGVPGLDVGGSGWGGSRTARGGLVNAGTLLTVGGLIWGALETMQQGSGASGSSPSMPPATPGGTTPAGQARGVLGASVPTVSGPPPLPPPIPGATPAPPEAAASLPVPTALLPLVQLAVSAARADGELSDEELGVIGRRAQALGARALVDDEIAARRPIESITPAFQTVEQRQMAYALAYAVVHGDEAVSPGERMYLTQLSRLLALSHEDVERIERETLASAEG